MGNDVKSINSRLVLSNGKDLKPILFNGVVSAVASKVLIPIVGFIPAMVIGTVAYELDPLEKAKYLWQKARNLTFK